jgi:rhodanese-related sulfurtransferase
MDGPQSISPQSLYQMLGTARAPLAVDVRRDPAFAADETMIAGAIRRPSENVAEWSGALPRDRRVVVYCTHGHEVSQGVATALGSVGVDAAYLEGGIALWAEHGLPRRRKHGATPGTWVTRERPKIDRIACPWLVRRFIDPEAIFLYVPTKDVLPTAERTGAVAYDIPGAEPFSHEGERCSFDAFLSVFGLEDPALDRLALIVRGADTSRLDLTPQSSGLFALSLGLSLNFPDDHVMLEQGMTMYDALYAWCRSLQGEEHSWPPKMS